MYFSKIHPSPTKLRIEPQTIAAVFTRLEFCANIFSLSNSHISASLHISPQYGSCVAKAMATTTDLADETTPIGGVHFNDWTGSAPPVVSIVPSPTTTNGSVSALTNPTEHFGIALNVHKSGNDYGVEAEVHQSSTEEKPGKQIHLRPKRGHRTTQLMDIDGEDFDSDSSPNVIVLGSSWFDAKQSFLTRKRGESLLEMASQSPLTSRSEEEDGGSASDSFTSNTVSARSLRSSSVGTNTGSARHSGVFHSFSVDDTHTDEDLGPSRHPPFASHDSDSLPRVDSFSRERYRDPTQRPHIHVCQLSRTSDEESHLLGEKLLHASARLFINNQISIERQEMDFTGGADLAEKRRSSIALSDQEHFDVQFKDFIHIQTGLLPVLIMKLTDVEKRPIFRLITPLHISDPDEMCLCCRLKRKKPVIRFSLNPNHLSKRHNAEYIGKVKFKSFQFNEFDIFVGKRKVAHGVISKTGVASDAEGPRFLSIQMLDDYLGFTESGPFGTIMTCPIHSFVQPMLSLKIEQTGRTVLTVFKASGLLASEYSLGPTSALALSSSYPRFASRRVPDLTDSPRQPERASVPVPASSNSASSASHSLGARSAPSTPIAGRRMFYTDTDLFPPHLTHQRQGLQPKPTPVTPSFWFFNLIRTRRGLESKRRKQQQRLQHDPPPPPPEAEAESREHENYERDKYLFHFDQPLTLLFAFSVLCSIEAHRLLPRALKRTKRAH